jgi:rubrerythrin
MHEDTGIQNQKGEKLMDVRKSLRGTAVAGVFGLMMMAVPQTWGATGTLQDMQAAFNGESNAHARYLAFAKKADSEGYAQIARLFRAAARAEQIHADNHAAVIKKMGATPTADVEQPGVNSTHENLEAAIKGESYERDVMYPAFLKQARAERNRDAVRSLNFAMSAERQHAALYAEAAKNMNAWRMASNDFYVCPTCGSTWPKFDGKKCPICRTSSEKFEKII